MAIRISEGIQISVFRTDFCVIIIVMCLIFEAPICVFKFCKMSLAHTNTLVLYLSNLSTYSMQQRPDFTAA